MLSPVAAASHPDPAVRHGLALLGAAAPPQVWELAWCVGQRERSVVRWAVQQTVEMLQAGKIDARSPHVERLLLGLTKVRRSLYNEGGASGHLLKAVHQACVLVRGLRPDVPVDPAEELVASVRRLMKGETCLVECVGRLRCAMRNQGIIKLSMGDLDIRRR